MRRFTLLFLLCLLLPACSFAGEAVSSADFFYTYGAWESAQADDPCLLDAVSVSPQGNETLFQIGSVSVGSADDGSIFLVRAELDASDSRAVSTMVSLCAALASDPEPSEDRILETIALLSQAAGRTASDPMSIGAYDIFVQSDGSVIAFSALLRGYEQTQTPDAPAAESSPASCRVATGGGTLRLRSEPDAKASILARIPNGASLVLLDRGEEWCHVQYQNRIGYVMTRYLSFDP